MAALRRNHPDAEIRAVHLAWNEPRAALLEHRVDAVVCRLPLVTEGLEVTVLYPEPRVLIVPVGHRLAGKESVTVEDIADEPLPRMAADPAWNDFWRAGSTADGPTLGSLEDKAELIASGELVAIVPAGLSSYRPDLTEIPLHGVEPPTWCSRPGRTSVAVCSTTCAGPSAPTCRPARPPPAGPTPATARRPERSRRSPPGSARGCGWPAAAPTDAP